MCVSGLYGTVLNSAVDDTLDYQYEVLPLG